MSEPTILISEQALHCASWERFFLLVWRGPATAERAKRGVTTFDAFLGGRQGDIGLMGIVNPEAPPPQGEARTIFAEKMHEAGTRVRASAYYVPIDGFRGSVMRSAITGLNMLARNPYPTRAFAEIPAATAWLTRQFTDAPARLNDDLGVVVEHLQTLR